MQRSSRWLIMAKDMGSDLGLVIRRRASVVRSGGLVEPSAWKTKLNVFKEELAYYPRLQLYHRLVRDVRGYSDMIGTYIQLVEPQNIEILQLDCRLPTWNQGAANTSVPSRSSDKHWHQLQ